MLLHVLASGSSGNCAIVQSSTTSLMIDCGITRKALRERTSALGVEETAISAVLVTHEHNDHIKGLGVCLRGLHAEGEMPIFCTSGTRESARYLRDYPNIAGLRAGDSLRIGDISIDVFTTSHDAAEPVGFRFTDLSDSTTIGYITDSGVILPEALEMLRGVEKLAIETNHDTEMLRRGPYPAFLQARISSERGHLSNEQAASGLASIVSDHLTEVVGMHISRENNDSEIPTRVLTEELSKIGVSARVRIAGQNIPTSV